MSDWQRNQHVADVGNPRDGGFEVHVARWPGYSGGREDQVMWLTPTGHYHYLPAWAARQFASALTKAADAIEGGP
jgi:hypothetical protein